MRVHIPPLSASQSTNIMVTVIVMPDPLSKPIRPRGSKFYLARKLWVSNTFHPVSKFLSSFGWVLKFRLLEVWTTLIQDSNFKASFGVSGSLGFEHSKWVTMRNHDMCTYQFVSLLAKSWNEFNCLLRRTTSFDVNFWQPVSSYK